ncbi:MAG: DUF2085 domain-containing protein [Thermomicrobiales bacterium]
MMVTIPHSTPEHTDAEVEELLDQIWRAHRPVPELPGWLPVAMAVLPYVLITVTIINGLIGVVAIITPLIAASSWSGVAGSIYSAYSLICPQRPDHTFFINGYPMAFEERDLSMHLGFGFAGLLYLRARFIHRPLPTTWLVAGVAPMLIDVAISTLGMLPATAISRTWTGALASFVIVWWSYPRFSAMLVRVQEHVAAVRARIDGAQPGPDWFVLAEGRRRKPANERI